METFSEGGKQRKNEGVRLIEKFLSPVHHKLWSMEWPLVENKDGLMGFDCFFFFFSICTNDHGV